jgi:hypothetical protein
MLFVPIIATAIISGSVGFAGGTYYSKETSLKQEIKESYDTTSCIFSITTKYITENRESPTIEELETFSKACGYYVKEMK